MVKKFNKMTIDELKERLDDNNFISNLSNDELENLINTYESRCGLNNERNYINGSEFTSETTRPNKGRH